MTYTPQFSHEATEVKLLQRIAALESQELGFVATLSQMEVEIAALREQVTDLQETKDVLYADNVRLIEQVARMPVCKGYVEAQDYARILTSDPIFDVTISGAARSIKNDHFVHPVYIDPPTDSGEG